MAHNIEKRNGKDSIVYAGETPWHRLGTKMPAAFDAKTALKHGGLDFTVEKVGIQTLDGAGIENRFALRRTDTKDVQTMFTGFLRKQLKGAAIEDYAARVIIGDEAGKPEDQSPIARKSILRICELHETGRGSDIKGIRGTLWGAYNAVTEYVDHDKTSDSLAYMATGRGAEIKQRAFGLAVELVKGGN